jgi:NAD(P)-dependent dehydrogenase (short-subunit alcohol dehydrogenase family)
LSQAIAEELAPFGAYFTSVSPGFSRTDFLGPTSVTMSDIEISDYAARWVGFRAVHDERNHTQAGDPAKLAQVLPQLAEVENPTRFIPGGLERRLVGDERDQAAKGPARCVA